MTDIGKSIKDYLNTWIECYYCNHMCKVNMIVSDNEDNPMCQECNNHDEFGYINYIESLD